MDGECSSTRSKSATVCPSARSRRTTSSRAPLAEGTTWSSTWQSASTGQRLSVPTVKAIAGVNETVMVPAGTFAGCLRLRITGKADVNLSERAGNDRSAGRRVVRPPGRLHQRHIPRNGERRSSRDNRTRHGPGKLHETRLVPRPVETGGCASRRCLNYAVAKPSRSRAPETGCESLIRENVLFFPSL